jgi:hypothetical protein
MKKLLLLPCLAATLCACSDQSLSQEIAPVANDEVHSILSHQEQGNAIMHPDDPLAPEPPITPCTWPSQDETSQLLQRRVVID